MFDSVSINCWLNPGITGSLGKLDVSQDYISEMQFVRVEQVEAETDLVEMKS